MITQWFTGAYSCGRGSACAAGGIGRKCRLLLLAGWSGPSGTTAMCIRCWWTLRAWRRPEVKNEP